jgi:alpha-amylase
VLAGLAACGGGGTGGSAVVPPPAAVLPTPDVSIVAAADPGATLADGWQQGAVMQVFVRSDQDSDGNGTGDLRGLASRLAYLQDLGVRGLWLMPVAKSQDRGHGYAVVDYRDVETDYGSLADLDELLRQAHARGIGVMLDYVINHSAALNPVFVNARASAGNAFRDWYVWQPAARRLHDRHAVPRARCTRSTRRCSRCATRGRRSRAAATKGPSRAAACWASSDRSAPSAASC